MSVRSRRFIGLVLLACTIGIFLAPGVVAWPGEGTSARRREPAGIAADPTPTTIVLQPNGLNPELAQDAHILRLYPDLAKGRDGGLRLRSQPEGVRILIRWNLESLEGMQIESARLSLYASYRSHERAVDVAAYRVKKTWVEDQVTWNEAATGIPWGEEGCDLLGIDREAIPVDTVHFAADSPMQTWYDWNVTAPVQEWLDGSSEENLGLILVAEGALVNYDFLSAESSAEFLRPKLIIQPRLAEPSETPTYTATPSPTETTTPGITVTASPTSSITPTPTNPNGDWIDISRAVVACCQPGIGCQFSGNTTGRPSNAEYYGNLSYPFTGGEDVYILHKTTVSDLALRLDIWTPGLDLDVLLLSAPDPRALLKDGDTELTYRNAGPGTYYIVIDGYGGSRGPYTLSLICSGEPSPTPTLTPTQTPTLTPSPTNTPDYSFYPLLFRQPTPTPTMTPTPTETPVPTATPTISAFDIAVNSGSVEGYLASDGYYYQSDQPYTSGGWGYWYEEPCGACVSSTGNAIDATEDDTLYQTHRYAMYSYAFDVPPGRYQVVLHFAEIARYIAVGRRVFDVSIEGQTVLSQYDMLTEGLRNRAGTKVFEVEVLDDRLDIGFVHIAGDYWPAINAIRVSRLPG